MAGYQRNPDLARRFGQNIFMIRRRAGLSQEELAFRSSLHRNEIGKLERGDRIPRIDTVIRLAGALEVPPADLLKGMAWVTPPSRMGRFVISG